VIHGDFGPWNLIWREELPVAIIDFDNARPGSRLDDVGYALWKHLNPGLVDLPAAEQARRGRIFVGAYDAGEIDLLRAIESAQHHAALRFAAHGWDLTELDAERAWLATHRGVFV